jgi:hypothetical protein
MNNFEPLKTRYLLVNDERKVWKLLDLRYTMFNNFFFLKSIIRYVRLTCKKTNLIVNLKKKLLKSYKNYFKSYTTIISY